MGESAGGARGRGGTGRGVGAEGGGGPEEDEARDVLDVVGEAGVDPKVDRGGHAVDDADEAKDPDEEEAVDHVEPRLLQAHFDQEPVRGRRPRHVAAGGEERCGGYAWVEANRDMPPRTGYRWPRDGNTSKVE